VIIGSHWRAGRVRVREIGDDEGNRLRRIVRRGTGPEVTWRRTQMVSWSAQGMSVAQIARPAFTRDDRVRDVLRNFNADGLDSLYPRYAGGIRRSSRWASGGRSRSSPSPRLLSTAAVPPVEPGQARRFPGRRGDRRGPLPPTAAGAAAGRRASPVRLLKTWKTSADPHHAARRARVEHLYAIADGQVTAGPGDPVVIRCVDLCRYRDYADVLTVGVCP